MAEEFLKDNYEPLKSYNNLEQKHIENIDNFFEDLTKKSKVDIESNKITVKNLRHAENEYDLSQKQLKKQKKAKMTEIIFLVLSILATAISIFVLASKITNSESAFITLLVTISVGFILIITMPILLGIVTVPRIKKLIKNSNIEKGKIDNFTKEGYEQMEPLNVLFQHGIKEQLFSKSIPLLKIDRFFDNEKLARLQTDYGLDNYNDDEISNIYIQSGELKGNPFLIANRLEHTMGLKTYTGHLVISWTESTTDSNGNIRTIRRSQTLTASVEKPCPYYVENPFIIFGSEVEPNFSFERTPNFVHEMSDKKLAKFIKSQTKIIEKLSKQGVGDSNFTALGNTDFEAIWNALERDNEKSYRMLFTPLAQKTLTDFLMDKEIGYGDDFIFKKIEKLNVIKPEHFRKIDFNADEESYYDDLDFEAIKERFKTYQLRYFRHLFLAFAPLLSIPIYQQTATHEFIYRDTPKSKLNNYEYENILNALSANLFKHKLSKTKNIIKTQLLKVQNNKDIVKVNSWGYDIEDMVEYVYVIGGDGNTHAVPVHWDKYTKQEQDTIVEITPINEYRINYNEWKKESDQYMKPSGNEKDDKIYFAKSSLVKILKDDFK
ncbi:MAG1210 family protein [Mycoplasma sp. Mirounga ES2805-ORL]|uniref:MAG1210 family protein n=1 Tax=Mycoplasma sp. Mirounga ES2805-ORL TaxID=754514 RepID=UPI00197C015D|nr:hypothetical protein [Mycoplasma sp. Mirounga ES2805-ORL]QSF13549.1 hypothetical protein JXZ90_02645 [Mycoplasma sp. Mirounga ES2805-ORL]